MSDWIQNQLDLCNTLKGTVEMIDTEDYKVLLEALKLSEEALDSCVPMDCSTGHVINPSFDEDAVNKALAAFDALGKE